MGWDVGLEGENVVMEGKVVSLALVVGLGVVCCGRLGGEEGRVAGEEVGVDVGNVARGSGYRAHLGDYEDARG